MLVTEAGRSWAVPTPAESRLPFCSAQPSRVWKTATHQAEAVLHSLSVQMLIFSRNKLQPHPEVMFSPAICTSLSTVRLTQKTNHRRVLALPPTGSENFLPLGLPVGKRDPDDAALQAGRLWDMRDGDFVGDSPGESSVTKSNRVSLKT